jgi:two-component system response regulator PilR (NtrC family)
VNCGALPETLLESELFGHVRGAFTDAHQNRKGLFEVAHRGTLFLDEVGEMSTSMQVKLLRALQERTIRRVGATDEVAIDVRLIGATNQSLDGLVRQRRFREDLYYRLAVIPIHVPPLRERRDDIPLLAEHFLARFAAEARKPITHISPEAMDVLVRHRWPGNVRELENLIERAVALETSTAVMPERLPPALRAGPSPAEIEFDGSFQLDAHLRRIEADLVRKALDQAHGNRTEACHLLGISPRSLRYLISKHGLSGEGATESGVSPKSVAEER